jgi:hypothetical protein
MAGKNSACHANEPLLEIPLMPYEPVLSAKARELLGSQSRKRQQRLIKLIHQLANHPSRLGDYQTCDSTGRTLENLQLDDFLFTYWADGPVNELRILDIVVL